MMEKGELDEDRENGSDEEQAKPTTLGKLGKLALATKENANDAQEEYAVEEGRDTVANTINNV